MRKTLLFFMLISVKLTFAQLTDDFSDGNFTQNPTWTGNTSLFTVNANKQLQTVSSVYSQTVSLTTSNVMVSNVKWEFFIQLNFDPSATNLARVYLVSNQQDIQGSLNGYFLQVGESGTADSYDLYKQTGTAITKIIDGAVKNRSNANVLQAKIKITRSDLGKWELYTAIDGSSTFVLEGSIMDNTFIQTAYFGVFCRYTATRSNGFIFDDFKITELVPDVTPPTLLSAKVLDEFTVEATFSEALESSSALMATNYFFEPAGGPMSISATTLSSVYKLTFASALPTGDYKLTVNNVKDLKGNQIGVNNSFSLFYIKPYLAQKGDVVINEIFADFSPQINLPTAEYIELWNTTDNYILLNGFKYSDLTSTFTFTTDTLPPKSYLILCASADVGLYKSYGKTKGLSPWPSLNNDKDKLTLASPQGVIIDEVNYADTWYKDAVKQQGGYALELIDPRNRCLGSQNWMASDAAIGGTPGKQNSVYQRQLGGVAPKLINATIVTENSLRLTFSKPIDSLSAAILSNYNLNNGVGFPISALPEFPEFNTILLEFSSVISRGLTHKLTVNGLTDCAGSLIDATANTAELFWAKEIKNGDVLINEVLVNPRIGGVDFVEIYNNTDHVLDLKDLQIANLNAAGATANSKNISLTTQYLPAQTYWVLSTNTFAIKQHYKAENPSNFTQMPSMPVFNNDKGTVLLLTAKATIDSLTYNDKMHIELLKEGDGVSLERVSFGRPTNEPGNFKSAAQSVGFATPSYKNSQFENLELVKNKVGLASKTFSPDGDGFEDVLEINYQFAKSGVFATVNIYNDQGILIKKLQKNTTIATTGTFIWDGLNDVGQMSKVGIYIVKFDVFSIQGKQEHFSEACALATRLQ